jgi:hypothetical protein
MLLLNWNLLASGSLLVLRRGDFMSEISSLESLSLSSRE